jgi:hypothetical protein
MTRAPLSTRGDTAPRGAGRDDARDARIRRSAWVLGACAAAFYVVYIAWILWRAASSG